MRVIYSVLARSTKQRSKRWQRLLLYLSKPSLFTPLSFEWWLMDFTVEPLLERENSGVVVQPKELRLPPIGDNPSDGITLSEDEAEFLEYTLFRGWMQQWLKWVQWYAEVALDYNTPLSDLLEYPVVECHWKRRNTDNEFVRFGRLYDKVHQEASNCKVFAIEGSRSEFAGS